MEISTDTLRAILGGNPAALSDVWRVIAPADVEEANPLRAVASA